MAAEVRTSFRAILRHAKRLPTFGSANKEQWNYIVSKFREGKEVTDPKAVKLLRTKANSLAMLLASTDELNHLKMLDSGNTIPDSEKVANTAKGLGFTMPTTYNADAPSPLPADAPARSV